MGSRGDKIFTVSGKENTGVGESRKTKKTVPKPQEIARKLVKRKIVRLFFVLLVEIKWMKWKSTGKCHPLRRNLEGGETLQYYVVVLRRISPVDTSFRRVAQPPPRWDSSFRKWKWRIAKKRPKASTITGRRSLSSYDVV